MATFGEWLFAARKKAGMTQGKLGKSIKVSKNYISVLERDLIDPRTGKPPHASRKVAAGLAVTLGLTEIEGLNAAGYLSEPVIIDVPDDLDQPVRVIARSPGLADPLELAEVQLRLASEIVQSLRAERAQQTTKTHRP